MNELFAPLERRFPQDGMTLMQSLNELFNPSKVKAVEAQDVTTYGKSELESVTMHFANQPATRLNDERSIIDCLPFKQNMRRYDTATMSIFLKKSSLPTAIYFPS